MQPEPHHLTSVTLIQKMPASLHDKGSTVSVKCLPKKVGSRPQSNKWGLLSLGALGQWLFAKRKLKVIFSLPNTSRINSKLLSRVYKPFVIRSLFISGTLFLTTPGILSSQGSCHPELLAIPSSWIIFSALCWLTSKLLPLLGFSALYSTKKRVMWHVEFSSGIHPRNLTGLFGHSKWILCFPLVKQHLMHCSIIICILAYLLQWTEFLGAGIGLNFSIPYLHWFLAHKNVWNKGLQQMSVIQQVSHRPVSKCCLIAAVLSWMSYNPSEPQFLHLGWGG